MKKLVDYTEEEIINAMRNMQNKTPNELDKNTYHLFEAVMKIADERDEYKEKIDKTLSLLERRNEELSKTILGLPQVLNDYRSTLIEVRKVLGGKDD